MIRFSSVLSVIVVLITFVGAEHHRRQQNVSSIRNVRAHYDAKTDIILVDWEWSEIKRKELKDYKLFVRYKVSNLEWRRVPSDEDSLGAKIPLGQVLNNGDEFTVQVIAEPNEREFGIEQSDPLVIWIARRTDRGNESGENSEPKRRENAENGNGAASDEELLPPHNFTANVLGPGQVRLEWRQPSLPFTSVVPFYIVNARQLSANTGDRFPPQQDGQISVSMPVLPKILRSKDRFRPDNPRASPLMSVCQFPFFSPKFIQLTLRIDGTQFLLGNLVSGENYEFTIRTALDAERISSAAAIVEIAIPLERDLVEVGKLIVTSRFRPDGHGVVNLTWEVPQHLRGKILTYEMRYTEAGRARAVQLPFWQQLVVPGAAPTGEIHDMKSDSEYVLRIRTTMTSGAQIESGEFRIRTPKSAGANPIARLDVLYSSETPSVRLQWILAPHINIALVGGYDVFVTDRYDLPETEWSHRRLHGSEPQMALDSLSPSTTYFVRIDVRNSDGTDVKSQAAYRFTTFETLPLQSQRDFRHADTLAFQQIGHGRVKVQWEMPEAVKLISKGIIIYYNSDTREPLDRWHRMDLDSSAPRSIELIGLRANADYNVQIVPLGMDGRPMWTHTQRLQLRTKAEDDEDEYEEQMR
uniref:Fibronectin type-III domain-containing protein n=1 Tax=Globodera rostochiensis TaxID=31243 RepID=A0A914HU30_GLORO